MKCPACGRRMLNKGTYFDCSNILCDYEEEIENGGEKVSDIAFRHAIANKAIKDKKMKETTQCF